MGAEVKLHAFLSSTPDECDMASGLFNPEKTPQRTHWIEGWVGSTDGASTRN